MRANRLKAIWSEGKAALGGWLVLPSSISAEMMAHCGVDWLCIDNQHGAIDYQECLEMLQAISTTDTVPIVRVPWNEPGIIGKTLDAGAYGIIIPMVNTRAEAEAAVAACRYPPEGTRSYGPGRATLYAGRDYFPNANTTILCIPMIETKQAIANLDEIVSTPGIDAVYVGPSDLSVSHGLPPNADNPASEFTQAIDAILDTCNRHNVIPGVHCGSAAVAAKRIEQGFRFVQVCDDAGSMTRGAAEAVSSLRGPVSAPETAA